MKVVSVTITNREDDLIADALKSVVDWVDECIVINTCGKSKDYSVEESVAGSKLVKLDHKQIDYEYPSALIRNFQLLTAQKAKADWAIILDTDERIHSNVDIRQVLSTTDNYTFSVMSDTGEYSKEKIFKIREKGLFGYFDGLVHEMFIGNRVDVLPNVCFSEVPKSPEELRLKYEYLLDRILKSTQEDSSIVRWWYYLGYIYSAVGKHEEAIEAFKKVFNLNGYDEETALSYVGAAQCYLALGKMDEAIDTCALGMTKHAGICELPYYIAHSFVLKGNYSQAILWAQIAASLSEYNNLFPIKRFGFRNTKIIYEGPFDILQNALALVGRHDEAKIAQNMFNEARKARLEKYKLI